jgi:HPt (histidine-containing phosphotransfer) domain-containing protein
MNAAFDALVVRFRARCVTDSQTLAAVVGVGDVVGARELAHRLAGAAGTFGYPALSTAASALEEQVADGAGPDPALVARLQAELAAVSRAADA